MPVSAHPLRRDFYVYKFWANGRPFYVGIGRSMRGPDRIRYVKSLMRKNNAHKLKRAGLSVQVIAKLLRVGVPIRYSCTRRPMSRKAALSLERREIARLLRQGCPLANFQQNPNRYRDASKLAHDIRNHEAL